MNRKNSTAPLASICVPIYNGEAYLAACLDSIRAQTLGDFEVIIVDDNSTDRSAEIVEDYAQRDERFQFHRNSQRRGLVGNWNRCLELSRGSWIKFLFQDDLLENRCLERLVAACQKRNQHFGFCQRHIIFDEQATDSTRNYFTNHQRLLTELFGAEDKYFDAATFSRLAIQNPDENIIGEPTVTLFHRSLISEFGEFLPALIQQCDLEYWMRLGTNVGVVYVAEALATFRVHGKSTTSQNFSQREYATCLLDPLVVYYRYLHEKSYARFRRELFQTSGRLLNWWHLIWMVHKARKTAILRNVVPQWQQTKKNYPGLKKLECASRILMPLRSSLSTVGIAKPLKKIQ